MAYSPRQPVPNVVSTTAINNHAGKLPVERAEDKPAETVTKEKWARLLGLIADGVKVTEALADTKIARYTLEGILRTEPKRKEQFEDAKIAAQRRLWDYDTLDDIFAEIATGKYVTHVLAERFMDPVSFYKLVLNDPVTKDMYDSALRIQAEVMADEIIQIADDTQNDKYIDAKGNPRVDNEVVNRSRLKVDARKWKMAKLHWKRFGERIQQDVSANVLVDHVGRLEEARKRVEDAKRTVSIQDKSNNNGT